MHKAENKKNRGGQPPKYYTIKYVHDLSYIK